MPALTVLPHPKHASWVELLQHRAQHTPNFTVYRFLENGESVGDQRTFAQLHHNACAIAAHLRAHHPANSRLLLLHPPGLPFMDAYFGCLYAGMVPVPVNPPRANRHRQRVLAVIDDADASAILTSAADQSRLQAIFDVPIIASDRLPEAPDTFEPADAKADDLAFLQYTSGSTGTPKGVMVTHANLMANAYELHHGWGHRDGDVLVTWLPVFHDMGLIYGMLMLVYAGIAGVAMAPAAFLQRPLRWLRAISQFGGTHTAAPNFAYALCATRAANEPPDGLDLSRWRVAVNGAEPIQAETLDTFAQTFATYGFKRDSFCPGYGLAETTLKVTASAHHEPLLITTFDTVALESGSARPSDQGTRLVSCGRQPQRGGVHIVEPESGRLLDEDQVGEIWVHGPSVTAGYWQKAGHASFAANLDDTPHLRTGDLGFFHRGELYITGRIKDLIIVRGRNILPQDIEAAATASHPALQLDGSAAFSLQQDDQIGIACEINRLALRKLDPDAVIQAIRDAVWQAFDLDLQQVILLKPMRLPKTSSGKVQRQACRQQVLNGSLETLHQDQRQDTQIADPYIEVDAAAFWAADLAEQQQQLRHLLQRRIAALKGHTHPDLTRVALDSLQLLTLARQIEEDLQLQVPLAKFALAQSLDEWVELLCDPPQPLVKQASESDPHAVEPNQRALWFIHRSNPQQDPYCLNLAFEIAAPVAQVERAVPDLLAAHPAMSTRFNERNGELIRHFAPSSTIPISIHPAEPQLENLAAQPFNLLQQAPCRVHLVDQGTRTCLLLCVHHIVADFLALETLVRDLATCLSGAPLQQRAPLRTVRPQAADRDYWLDQLRATQPQPVHFADGFVAKDHNRLERCHLELDQATSVALEGRARQANTTLQSLLLACYAATWQRYNAPACFAVGVPVDVRSFNDPACGYGIHTLPVMFEQGRDLLQNTQQQLWRLLQHRGQTFEALAQLIPHQNDEHAIFQSMFTYHQDRDLTGLANWFLQPGQELQVGAWSFTSRALAPPRAALPLSVTFAHRGNQLVGVLDSDQARLPQGWTADFRDTLKHTLEQVAAKGSQLLQQPQSLPLPHPARLVPPAAAERCRDIVTSLLEQVARQPDAAALHFRDQVYSYAQLHAMAGRVAAALQQQGIAPGDRVALVCRREPMWIAAMLGVASCGAAFVPISDSLPAKRIAYMLENSQPRLVALTHESHAAQDIDLPLLKLWQLPEQGVPLQPADADGMAYTLYTSGSTGQPKGVAVHHGGFANLLDHYQTLDLAQAPLRMAAMTTPIFDISLVEVFLPLRCGGTVVIAPSDDGIHQRADWINANQITILQGTPTTFKMLLSQQWRPKSHQHILMGGEAISHQLVADLSGAAAVWNQYGPTEVSVWTSIRRIDRDRNHETHSPVGGAIRAVEVYILDPQMRQLPRGCAGELAIGGMPLALGYWDKPELTAERFRPHPFSQTPGARLYLTGDLARGRSDGTFAFLGRNDSQIKLRGFRIEIGEIERVLNQQAGVTDAVVMVRQFGPEDARLIAFLLAAEGLDRQALRAQIATQLPEYMVPSHFEILSQFPLTASNKTDRKALAALPLEMASAAAQMPLSDDPAVAQLTQLWREVLQKPELDAQANFFEHGGYSLLSLKLLDRIAQTCGARLTPRQLFEQPSPAQLAPLLALDHQHPEPEVCPAARTHQAPLHGIQRDFWVQEHNPRYNGFLHLAGYIDIHGPLDHLRLEAALQAIVMRHPALRLTFHIEADQPMQRIGDAAPETLDVVDLSAASPDTLQTHMQQFVSAPFDLDQQVYRYQLLQFDAEHHRLLLCFHHIVADGTSMTLFCNDLYRAYAEPNQPLAEAANWLDLEQGDADGDTTFWAQQLQLRDANCNLATLRAISPARGFKLAYNTQVLPADLLTTVRKFAQQQQTSPSAVIQALFAAWLHQLGAGQRFTIAVPVANRHAQGALEAFGPGINMLPIVVEADQDWRALLARSKQLSLELVSHPAASLGQIMTLARQQLDGADLRPYFLYNWVPQRRHQFEVAGTQFQIHEQPPQRADYLLSLEVIEREDGAQLRFAWAEELFQPGIALKWQQLFVTLLQQLESTRLPRLDTEADMAGFSWAEQADVWQQFAEQVQRRPQQSALLWQAQQTQFNLTYAALQQRAETLAAQLLQRGLEREQVVALALDRGVSNVVAMLAVLRAGAAFLPIAANVPIDRARWMLADSGAVLLLAEQTRLIDFADQIETLCLDREGRCFEIQEGVNPSDPSNLHVPVPCSDDLNVPVPDMHVSVPDMHVPVPCSDDLHVPVPNITPGTWPAIQPQQLAYLIYTSGTTGKPKAVAISRANLSAHLQPVAQTYGLRACDRISHQSSVGFDIIIEEVFASLAVGATILPIAEAVKTDFNALASYWRDLKPDVATINASLWQAWAGFIADDLSLPLPRVMIVGAERLAPSAAQAWLKRQPTSQVTLNAYGPTETTVSSSTQVLTLDTLTRIDRVPIGHAIPCGFHLVVDHLLRPLPNGVRGELVIGGPTVGRGYWQRPDLTAERFRPDPFSGRAGARLYLSGDLAVALDNGAIDLHGRVDHQVKLRGYRIELGEIENRLEALSGVQAAAVYVHQERDLVAVIVCDGSVKDWQQNQGLWLQQLQADLPGYMLPTQWLQVEQLPRLTNGKLDRTTLMQMYVPVSNIPVPEVSWQPQTAAETALSELWRERWPDLDASSHFFRLGGDSIWAITLTAKLRQQGWRLTMEDFYLAPNLSALATRMQPLGETQATHELDTDQPLAWPPLAATMIAQGMSAHSDAYFNQLAVRIDGPLDRERMLSAWRELHKRHDGLQLCVAFDEHGQPQPQFDLAMLAEVTLLDATHVEEDQLSDYMQRAMQQDKQRPFKLDQAPLWRVKLFAIRADLHVLLLSHHHLVLDGWSLSPLFMSVLARYAGETATPTLSLRHYLAQLARQSTDEAEAFWRAQLRPLKMPTRLPLLRSQSPKFQVRHALLDLTDSQAWQQAAARHQVTLAALMQAAWACTLAPFQQQRHLVFGTVNAGRNLDEYTYTQTVGLMIQSLPTVVDTHLNIGQLLQQLHADFPQASRHGHLPLRRIQACAPEWPAGAQLFESIVVVENYPIDQALSDNAHDLQFSAIEMDEATELPLVLTLMPQTEGWRARLSYRDPWWSAADADKLLERWHQAMDALCTAQTDTPIQQLQHTQTAPTPSKTSAQAGDLIPERLASLFARHADQPAFIGTERTRDFAWLQVTSLRWAAALKQRGITSGDVVGISLPNDERVHAAILALWYCGAAFCPIDTQLPTARVQIMADNCSMRWLLTDRALELDGVTCLRTSQLCVDTKVSFTPQTLHPQMLAYVLFTSGSTGTPKGVAISHAALAFYCDFAARQYLQTKGGVPFFGNLAFDATQTTLWPALLAGQPLHLLDTPGEVLELVRWLVQPRQVAMMKLTPAHLHALSRVLDELGQQSRTRIDCVVLGGEALTPKHVSLCRALFGPGRIVNEYGPTEATVGCITFDIEADTPLDPDAAIAIGAPIPGSDAYVLHGLDQQVVEQAEGELYLAGPNLARGYFNRPADTAAAFVPDPFATKPGQRMYRSGDLASVDQDGAYVYRGRKDQMLKWRGYRIEPAEIETCLRQVADVREVVVMVRAKGLVAWVSCDLAQVDAQDLRHQAENQLPPYMVPTRYVLLDALPLTHNGKVDRDALLLDKPDSAADVETLQGEAEHWVASWLAEALAIPQPGPDDHFFALGGDSIVAIQLAAKAQALGLRLSPVDIMTSAHVRGIAARLERNHSQVAASEKLTQAPFTPIMRWLQHQNGNLPGHYNQSVQLQLEPRTDIAQLRDAVRESIAAHDIFVARFFDGQIHRGDPTQLPSGQIIDLRALSETAAQAKRNQVCSDIQASFNPAQGRNIDFAIFMQAEKSWCFIVAHHLVCDGVTWRLLLQDIAHRYAEGAAMPPAPSFLNWAQQLSEYRVPQAALDFWQAQDLSPTPLPGVLANQAPDEPHDYQTQSLRLTTADTQQLLRLPLPMDVLLLTALNRALLPDGETLLVELEHQGREATIMDDAHRMAGWFTTLYPLRLTGCQDLESGLKQLHQQMQAVAPNRLAAGLCLEPYTVDVVFNYLGQLDGSLPAPFAHFVPRPADEHSDVVSAYAWAWQAWVREGQLEFNWTFSPQQIASTDVARQLAKVESALQAMLALPLSRFPANLHDYPLVDLQASQLQALVEQYGRPAQILPLLPVQQGMLFEDEVSNGAAYVSQLQASFDKTLDLDALKSAWQLLCQRHATLNSVYVWLGLDAPMQISLAQVELAWHTWRADQITTLHVPVPDTDLHVPVPDKLNDFAWQLRQQGFDLSQAPPMRFDIVEDTHGYHFFWTFHHIISDGWSNAILFRELEQAYVAAQLGQAAALPEPTQLQRFVEWQNQLPSNTYWRGRLANLEDAALLPVGNPSEPWLLQADLDDDLIARLNTKARAAALTPFTLIQAAFALMLQRQTGAPSISFGITHAGRDAQIPGIEQIVGPLLCTLPTLTDFPDVTLNDWLHELANKHLADRQHGNIGLPKIRQQTTVPSAHPLFEALLVLENYPLDVQLRQSFGGVAVSDVAVEEASHYALGASITLQPQAQVTFVGDGQKLGREQALACLDDFCSVLQLLVDAQWDRLHRFTQFSAPTKQLRPAQETNQSAAHLAGNPSDCATLCTVFAQVLGHAEVSAEQGFHALGGDSIAAMVLVSRARQTGFNFGIRDLLQWQTPQALCGFLTTEKAAHPIATIDIGTAVPLLPMQRHFLTHQTALHLQFAMPIALAVEQLQLERLQQALSQVCQRHLAFTLGFAADPQPRAFVRSGPTHTFNVIDTHLGQNPLADLAHIAAPFHLTPDLAEGPLLHALLVRDQAQNVLILTAHHLIVDAVSWATILQDLSMAYNAEALRPIDPQQYLRVAQQAAAEPFDFEPQPIDLGQAKEVVPSFASQVEQAHSLSLNLDREADAETLLLTALLRALQPWLGTKPAVLRESHGRSDLPESDGLCGWFTRIMRISADMNTPVSAQLHQVRDRLQRKATSGSAGVLFNYLGRATSALPQPFSEWLEVPFTHTRPPEARPDFELEVSVMRTASGFATRFRFTRERLAQDWIAQLNVSWQTQLNLLAKQAQTLLRLQDFPLLAITQQQLDLLAADTEHFADLWPLSPLQQGLLYHAVAAKAQAYHEQLLLTLSGELDLDRFCAAWRATFEHHESLRTAFRWQPLPLQVVYTDAPLPIQVLDFSDRMVNDATLQRLLEEDRQQGFSLDQAPLARLIIVRAAHQTTHVLFAHHHLILDGWSANLVLAEVVARYAAARNNTSYQPPRAASYATYLTWLQQQDQAALQAYWAKALEGFEGASPLPLARTSFADATEQALLLQLDFDGKAQAALRQLQDRCGVTYSVLCQAAWALIVSRYGNCADPLFGVTFAGRPEALPQLEYTPGLFVQTLPIRANLNLAADVPQWLESLAQQQLDHQEHGGLPLSDIQASSEVPAGQELFDALLVFGAGFHADAKLADQLGVTLQHAQVHETTHYPLTLTFLASDSGFAVRLAARPGFYNETSLRQLVGAMEAAWLDMAQQLDKTPRQLDCVSHDHHNDWVQAGLGRSFEVPAEDPQQPAYLRIKQADPSTTAICDEAGNSLTYGQLTRTVDQIAAQLQARGVVPGDGVLVCLPREAQSLAVLLAIHTIGAYYIPLDPDYPAERIALIAADAQAKGLVTQTDLLRLFPPATQAWLLPDLCKTAPLSPKPVPHIPAALSHVIYTSGSTGKPKGVAITHSNVAALTAWARERYPASVWQGVVAGTSLCFDLSIFELFVTLSLGGRILLVQNALSLAGDALPTGARLINTVPSAMSELLQLDVLPASIEAINLAGEPLRDHLAQAIQQRLPGVLLHNLYGPTEATTYITEQAVPPLPVTIGRALPYAAVHVLDKQLRPLPPGVRGEGYICGPHVAQGYLGNAVMTAERFLPDPFESPSGEAAFGLRMYHTGDLLWRDQQGQLHFVGRVDFQVKVNGFRVELGDIEACLNTHASVDEAIVITQQQAGVTQLLAFVKSAQPDQAETLKAYLASQLPHYMVPARITVLEALPLTPNGKVDRKALPGLLADKPHQNAPASQEANFPEAMMLQHLLLDVLNPPSLNLEADFWQLGGHSLLALRLLGRINDTFSLQLPLASLLEAPSMLDLARELASRQKSAIPLTKQAEDAPLRLAPLQTRLWFLSQLESQANAYNMPFAVSLRGPLDVPALDIALRHLGQQHAVLRTYVADTDGVFYQLLDSLPPLQLEAASEADLQQAMQAEAQIAFDVAHGPLIRYRLLQLDHDWHVLLLTVHHLVFDGWSLGLLVRDLTRNYAAQLAAAPLPTPQPLQYHDYAAWEWQRQAQLLDAERAYWSAQLADLPAPLPLPFDHDAAAIPQTGTFQLSLDTSFIKAVQACAKTRQMTPFMVLQASFAVALANWAGVDDLVIGTPASNRPHPKTEDMVGMFVNTLPLRLKLEQQSDFAALLALVRTTTLDAFAHSAISFDQIVDLVQPPRMADRPAIFQVLFALQNLDLPRFELAQLDCEVLEAAPPQAKLDLSLYVTPSDGNWSASFEYRADRFEATTIEAFAQQWQQHLKLLLEQPKQTLHFQKGTPRTVLALEPTQVEIADQDLLDLVASVFAEVLSLKRTDLQADVDFFALGGNSLLAARAIARLRRAMGFELPLKTIFDHPTAAQLANAIATLRPNAAQHNWPALPSGNQTAPLSLTQNGMWVMHQTEGHTGNFNMARAAWLEGQLDADRLRRAVACIHIQQPLLQARLTDVAEPKWQLSQDLPLPFIIQQATDDASAQTAANGFAVAPFDLTQVGPVRYLLLQTSAQRYLFVIVLHHIAGDEWSLQVLYDQLMTAYAGDTDDAKMAAPKHSYLDFAHWQRQWLTGQVQAEHLAFFKQQLQHIPTTLTLPTDRPRPTQQGFAAATLNDQITAGTLQAFARNQGATLYQLCFAAFALLLSRHAQQWRLAIATPAANRPMPELETMVGCFANTLVAAVDWAADTPFAQAFAKLREHLFEVQRHQALPFELLVRHVNPPRDDSRHPLAQVGFALQNVPRQQAALQDVTVEPASLGELQARFDLELYLHESGDDLIIDWIYKTELFDAATIATFNRQWQHLLQAIIAAPTTPLEAIPLDPPDSDGEPDLDALSEADLDALLGDLIDEDLP